MSSALPLSIEPSDEIAEPVDAGPFGVWLAGMQATLRGDRGTDVPCGNCVGCCVSSYYIVVRPEDTGALSRIPAELLRLPRPCSGANAMMGYRADGTCPMLQAGKCSIYADRPQTCRDYDCRIFAAAGIEAGGADKRVINRRVRAWRFDYASDAERRTHAAIRAAAAFIRDKQSSFLGSRVPTTPTGIAVLALKAHPVFLDPQTASRSDAKIASAVIAANRAFDAATA